MIGQHRHPSDLSARHQPCAAHGLPGFREGEEVAAALVLAVPLDVARHALFLDEHQGSDVLQGFAMAVPVDGG